MNKKILTSGLISITVLILTIAGCGKMSGNNQPIDFSDLISKDQPVQTTQSGLKYIVVKQGLGASPTATDRVKVNYRGAIPAGENFDASNGMTFGLNQVIRGWTEGIQLMKEGGQYRFIIPPQLAYGERGAGGVIGPNQTLIFDVELLEVISSPGG